MTAISIRALLETDISKLAEINVTTYPWTEFKLSKENACKFLQERLNREVVFVATTDDEPIGFIAIRRDFLFGNYVRRIVIHKDFRSKGIGSQLLKYVEELTLASKLPNVFLLCSVGNARAIEFYKKNGYTIVGEIKDFIDTGLHEYLFRKSFGTVNDFEIYD